MFITFKNDPEEQWNIFFRFFLGESEDEEKKFWLLLPLRRTEQSDSTQLRLSVRIPPLETH